jgi:hypothetical protein
LKNLGLSAQSRSICFHLWVLQALHKHTRTDLSRARATQGCRRAAHTRLSFAASEYVTRGRNLKDVACRLVNTIQSMCFKFCRVQQALHKHTSTDLSRARATQACRRAAHARLSFVAMLVLTSVRNLKNLACQHNPFNLFSLSGESCNLSSNILVLTCPGPGPPRPGGGLIFVGSYCGMSMSSSVTVRFNFEFFS